MSDFWTSTPIFNSPFPWVNKEKEDELYKLQINHLSNALLIDDYNPNIVVDKSSLITSTSLLWPNRGELVSGSFISATVADISCIGPTFSASDIDIYFHNVEDAKTFCAINSMHNFDFNSPICGYGAYKSLKINLIYGIEYSSPEKLISRFDIRACSIAFDPNTNELYSVRGSMLDVTYKNIVFNPVPRGVSVKRLVKYINKGFSIDKYQRLFFANLVSSKLYSQDLELLTSEY